MDDFKSSLERLEKQREKERKKLLAKREKEKIIEATIEDTSFKVAEYYSNVERRYIKQQHKLEEELERLGNK